MKVKAAEYTTSYGKKCSGCFLYLSRSDYWAARIMKEGTLSNMLATIKCLSPVRHSLIVVTKNRALFFV